MLKKINKERQIIQGLDESEETEEENVVDSKEKNVLKESESYVVARFFFAKPKFSCFIFVLKRVVTLFIFQKRRTKLFSLLLWSRFRMIQLRKSETFKRTICQTAKRSIKMFRWQKGSFRLKIISSHRNRLWLKRRLFMMKSCKRMWAFVKFVNK